VEVISREALTHRDYLGALMGLGIKREKIGDILVSEETCSIIVLNEIADYIFYNLDKVGNTRIKTVITDVDELVSREPKLKEISATVASLRLDCIASAGFGISRSKMVDFIKGEKVNLNWDGVSNPTKQVKAGDTISMRGMGRLVLDSVGGTTKKDRIKVVLKKYI
jgi:RNA-binding protein YlmH